MNMVFSLFAKSDRLPEPDAALPGRSTPLIIAPHHFVSGRALAGPYPDGYDMIGFGMGCFWGAERLFWTQKGVYVTAVGYQGGLTPNPTYREVCSGLTGHTEVVRVIYDPASVDIEHLLAIFWQSHDPTQGMRQGNDRGTQYRSAIFPASDTQLTRALESRARYQKALNGAGRGEITTEIAMDRIFYFAETEHQQYLAKHPDGYCGLAGTGIACPFPA